ncbi:hypothetical protein Tco_0714753 [Tanacetum coccineum]
MKIIINHGGTFTTPPMIRYKGGKVNWVDDIDSNIFSIVEVTKLAVDKDVCEMLMYVDKFKVIELYADHSVNKKHVFIQEPLTTTSEPNEPDIGSGSEAEVDVSEDEWLKEALKKLPIKSKDKGQQTIRKRSWSISGMMLIWLEFTGSLILMCIGWLVRDCGRRENEVFELEEVDHEDFDSGSELDEGVRRKALRKVSRMNKAKVTIWKENFFVGEQGQVPDFANNNMGSVLPVTSDPKGPTSIVKPKSISKKEKVTKPKGSYGCPWAMQVSKFPNKDTWELEESIKPNPKIPLNALKDQLQKKFEV